MRKALVSALTLLLVAVGCPRPDPQSFKFTSADVGTPGRGGLFDAVNGAPTDADGQELGAREVLEPDVYRRRGDDLFVLNQFRGLTWVDLETQTVRAQVPTYGFPRDLYIADDRAYVLVGNAGNYTIDGDTFRFSLTARLYVVDISSAEQAGIVSSFELAGDLVDSRLVGDVLYAVCAEYEWYWSDARVEKAQTSGSWVTSVNVADPYDIYEADEVSFGGVGNVIQVTPDAVFVAAHEWSWETRGDWTTITYVDISDPLGAMRVRGQASVRGFVADRFKMDAWNGALRVVSNAWEDTREVYVTTVSLADPDQLDVLAELRLERASGDTLFATRFDGDKAYVVTYFLVDPLFVLDLSDPANPRVAGELEVPGWSTHIEPRGDRLIALGVDDTQGWLVSVSLFDVSDPAAPTLVDRASFGDGWSWSSAYEDVRAFTVCDGLLIVPFGGWTSDFGGYERLQFVSFTEEGLEPRGYIDLDGRAVRSFEHGEFFYGLSSEQLVEIDATDLDAPQVTHRIALAEDLADFIELSPEFGVQIMPRYDSGRTTVRSMALGNGAIDEVTVEIGAFLSAHRRGGLLALVGTVWDPVPGYRVAVIDCANPAALRVVETLGLDVEPMWAFWPYRHGGVLAVEREWWPWWSSMFRFENTFLVGDLLALRCAARHYDAVLGEGRASQGLALVDLRVPAWTGTLGLGGDSIVSLDQAGDRLYLGTMRDAGRDPDTGLALCAYHLSELDIARQVAGPAANVPGVFVGYRPESDLLILRDEQWRANGDYSVRLRTARWDGAGEATALSSRTVPEAAFGFLGRDDRVFFDVYQDGYRLYAARVSSQGAITIGDGVLVTPQWGMMVDARGDDAYVTVGNGVVARYRFEDAGRLADFVEVMGTPARIRFGANQAYAPLGYFGLVTLPY